MKLSKLLLTSGVGLALGVALCARADELVLKSGKKYRGTIVRADEGKVAVVSDRGRMAFNDDLVSFRLSKFTPPGDVEQVAGLLNDRKFTEVLPLLKVWEERYRDLPCDWNEQALRGIGLCLASGATPDASMPYYEKLLAMFPETRYRNEAEYWMIELQTAGTPGPELEAKLKALLDNPKTSDRIRAKAHEGLGGYYVGQSNWFEGLEHYVSIVVLYGDIDDLQEHAQRACADLFLQIGRTNEARFYYSQLTEIYPESESAADAAKQLSRLNP
jgi:tetratricopeptide (TPR) repeat protein